MEGPTIRGTKYTGPTLHITFYITTNPVGTTHRGKSKILTMDVYDPTELGHWLEEWDTSDSPLGWDALHRGNVQTRGPVREQHHEPTRTPSHPWTEKHCCVLGIPKMSLTRHQMPYVWYKLCKTVLCMTPLTPRHLRA